MSYWLKRALTVVALAVAILGCPPVHSQHGELYYRYCSADGSCGLPGSNAPFASTPPQLRDADLAGRRYGPEGAQFTNAVQREQNSIAALKQSMAGLEGTPFAIDAGALNRQVLDYFSRPNLMQDLRNVYAAPTPVPAGGVPLGVSNGLEQTWQSLANGQTTELVRAATLIRGLQRQTVALSDTGNQQAAQYLNAELRRNFVDAKGLLRFLGNHDVYADAAPLNTPDPRLTFRLVDGVNKVISADFLLRQVYGGKLPADVAASFGAIAAGYHAASRVGQQDPGLAYAIADGLDSTLRVFDAFFSGFFEQAAETVDAFVSLVKNPVASINALASAIENYPETAKFIRDAVQAKYAAFKAGDAAVRAQILGEVSFDVATAFLGAGAAKYGTKAVEFVTEGSARLAVNRAIVRVARTASLGEGISAEAKAGLGFVESLRPSAAFALYDKYPSKAARIGENLNQFLVRGTPDNIPGIEFLRSHPEALDAYLTKVPVAMEALDQGGSIKVYFAVEKKWTQELMSNGLKGPVFKDWAEGIAGTKFEEGLRFGAGRYVASSPETAMLEPRKLFNPAEFDLIEADFKAVQNGGKGYILYPSTAFPGEFNVFDGAFDDFGAFVNPRVLP